MNAREYKKQIDIKKIAKKIKNCLLSIIFTIKSVTLTTIAKITERNNTVPKKTAEKFSNNIVANKTKFVRAYKRQNNFLEIDFLITTLLFCVINIYFLIMS